MARSLPLTGMIPPDVLINGGRQYHRLRRGHALTRSLFKLFATNHSPAIRRSAPSANSSAACPSVDARRIFAMKISSACIIMQFIDAHAFDVRSVKKTCVHIVHPDGRLIPFDTYNLFYRDDLERTRLEPLRRRRRAEGTLVEVS